MKHFEIPSRARHAQNTDYALAYFNGKKMLPRRRQKDATGTLPDMRPGGAAPVVGANHPHNELTMNISKIQRNLNYD